MSKDLDILANIITDMILKGKTDEQLLDMVEYSKKVIDQDKNS